MVVSFHSIPSSSTFPSLPLMATIEIKASFPEIHSLFSIFSYTNQPTSLHTKEKGASRNASFLSSKYVPHSPSPSRTRSKNAPSHSSTHSCEGTTTKWMTTPTRKQQQIALKTMWFRRVKRAIHFPMQSQIPRSHAAKTHFPFDFHALARHWLHGPID